MMWMIIPCLLLLGILLIGGDKLSSAGYLWLVLIGVFVIAHIVMMAKGRGGHGDDDVKEKFNTTLEEPDTKDEYKHSGGCH